MKVEISHDVAYELDTVLVQLSVADMAGLAKGENRMQTFSPASLGSPRALRFIVVYDAPKPEVDDIALD